MMSAEKNNERKGPDMSRLEWLFLRTALSILFKKNLQGGTHQALIIIIDLPFSCSVSSETLSANRKRIVCSSVFFSLAFAS